MLNDFEDALLKSKIKELAEARAKRDYVNDERLDYFVLPRVVVARWLFNIGNSFGNRSKQYSWSLAWAISLDFAWRYNVTYYPGYAREHLLRGDDNPLDNS